jgi:hypothetical protein
VLAAFAAEEDADAEFFLCHVSMRVSLAGLWGLRLWLGEPSRLRVGRLPDALVAVALRLLHPRRAFTRIYRLKTRTSTSMSALACSRKLRTRLGRIASKKPTFPYSSLAVSSNPSGSVRAAPDKGVFNTTGKRLSSKCGGYSE